MEFDEKKLAYCGIYCDQCSLVVSSATKNREHILRTPFDSEKDKSFSELSCQGCKAENSNCSVSCKIRPCAIRNKITCCADCESFPCEKILTFKNDDYHYHTWAYENLEIIKANGKEKWFEDFKNALHCHCGERSSWYLKCPVHSE